MKEQKGLIKKVLLPLTFSLALLSQSSCCDWFLDALKKVQGIECNVKGTEGIKQAEAINYYEYKGDEKINEIEEHHVALPYSNVMYVNKENGHLLVLSTNLENIISPGDLTLTIKKGDEIYKTFTFENVNENTIYMIYAPIPAEEE